MRIGKKLVALAVVLAIAAALVIPAVALAKGGKAFSATAQLVQTASGTPIETVSSGVPGFPDGIPGLLTTGQAFEGAVVDTDWERFKKADLVVYHNSFITLPGGVEDLFDDGTAALVGSAWGSFEIERGKKGAKVFSGNYLAGISGTLTFAPSCPVSVFGVGVWVDVTDEGFWKADSTDGGGGLLVTASGCLGQETASTTVWGVYGGHQKN